MNLPSALTPSGNDPDDFVAGNEKLIELEALRGIAAIIVLVHHSLLAFYPRFHGLVDNDSYFSLFGTPLFSLINGSAAVILFFVLSGFVLTLKAFQRRSYRPLFQTALKRWPRLVVPVLSVNIVSGFLAGWGFYSSAAVASTVKSTWLGWHFVEPPPGLASLGKAVYEGFFSTFVTGSSYFNSSTWTMKYEFLGSFLCLADAYVTISLKGFGSFGFLLAAVLALAFLGPFYWPFLVGVGLAAFYTSNFWRLVPVWVSQRRWLFWTLTATILFLLLGYHEPMSPLPSSLGFYTFLAPLQEVDALATRVFIHTIASVFLIALILATPFLKNWLRQGWGAWLGKISFSVYLVQIPVICFFACNVFLASLSLGETFASALAFVTAIVGSIMCAIPLMKVEAAWLVFLRRLTVG
jgi:peptidoglycan/LPS O-acetylase OafA/YrhL